ncbi:MAG TPA: amidohydrolase [Vicinamibacteria bacterium]
MTRRRAVPAALALGLLLTALGLTRSPAPLHAAEKADRIFINGRVWTGEPGKPLAEALAVRAQSILAVGKTSEIQGFKEKKTDVVDLKGRLVTPGFGDGHLHLMMGSLALTELDVRGATSVEELQKRLGEYARKNPAREWIVGSGWAYGDFPGGPARGMLDAVVSDRPVYLVDRDHHSALVNGVALAKAGITKATKDPEHGLIVRDAAGEATGLLKEAASQLVSKHIPEVEAEDRYRALKKGLDPLASYGLTSVQDAGLDEADLPVLDRLQQEGGLKLRVSAALRMQKVAPPEDLARYRSLRDRFKGPRLRVASVKGMVDGVVDAKTAYMLEPYVGGGTGLPNWTPEELNKAVAIYDAEGFQVLLHACGDRAVRMALDAFEKVGRRPSATPRRHRVEHAEVVSAADRPRFKALGVVASTQAIFANPDKTTLENYAVLLGPERAAMANAFKLFDDAGAVQAFGSDWPVFSAEVLPAIFTAVTRTTPEGTPAGGWYPENRVPVEAALRHFTRDNAYATFDEQARGTLATGKLADLVVLSDDVLSVPAKSLRARVVLTVLGGQDTYRAREF